MRRRSWTAPTLLLVVALTACGSTSGSSSSVTTQPGAGSLGLRPVLAVTPTADPAVPPTSPSSCDAPTAGAPTGTATYLGCEGGVVVSYTLGPTTTVSVDSAVAAGTQAGNWSVRPTLGAGAGGIDAFNALAAQCFDRQPTCPTGQLALVVDGRVVSAPTVQSTGFQADQIEVSGSFDEAAARSLVDAIMAPS